MTTEIGEIKSICLVLIVKNGSEGDSTTRARRLPVWVALGRMRVIGYWKVVELVFIDRYRRRKGRRGMEQRTRPEQGRRQVVA